MMKDGIVSIEDTLAIGHQVVDMAERVAVAHLCAPGSVAKWGFVMDGQDVEVLVRIAPRDER